jgi:hypothetical protein
MSRSEIFDAYEKIAIEAGLVSSDEQLEKQAAEERKDSPSIKRYKKSPAPRAGSDSISTIESLYGVKCDDTVKYENNIFENAHPNSVIIGPAYDRMNGLIENPNERQNFMINQIMDKCPNGNLTQHRYAKEELLMELIRIANDLDARGNEPLRVLADACIESITSEKKSPEIAKNAFAFIPIVIGMAALLTAIGVWNHVDDPNNGIKNNITRCIARLKSLKAKSLWEDEVDSVVQNDVDSLILKLSAFETKIENFGAFITGLNTISAPESLAQLNSLKQEAAQHADTARSSVVEIRSAIEEVWPAVLEAIENFTSQEYQNEHIESGSGGAMGWLGEAVHGRYGLFANDFISAANALGALKASLKALYDKVKDVNQTTQQNAQKLNMQMASLKGDTTQRPGATQPIKPDMSGEIEDDLAADDAYVEAAKAMGFRPKTK